MTKELITLLIFFSAFFVSCNNEQTINVQKEIYTDNPQKTELDKKVDSIFNFYSTKEQTSGFSIALINGDQVDQYNYGETKIGNKVLPSNQTLYEIGSISKTFVAIATHYWLTKVIKVDINTKINSYLPSNLTSQLSLKDSTITFKNLLNHTSGFPRIPNNLPNSLDPYNGYDSTKVFNYILNNSLVRTPGTTPQTEQDAINFYSNFAYGLTGIILERQQNRSLDDLLKEYVLNDLSINNTTFKNIEGKSNIAYPHNNTKNASFWHFSGLAGAGGLKSCLLDMIKYAKAQINSTNGSSIQICQDPSIKINDKDYFALGWEFYYTKSGKKITVKDGGTGGFTSFIAFDRQSKKAIIALFNNNNDNNPSEPFINLLEEFFK